MQAAFARLAALWYGLGSCSRTVVVDKDLCSMYIIPLFTVLFNSVTISIQSSEVQKHRRCGLLKEPRLAGPGLARVRCTKKSMKTDIDIKVSFCKREHANFGI